VRPCAPVVEVLSPGTCAALREAFLTAGYHADGVLDLLGAAAHDALGRGEPEPARRASRDAGALGTLVRLFLLGDAEREQAVRTALFPLRWDEALAGGLVRADGDTVRAGLDVRPHADDAGGWWVVADLDSDQRGGPVAVDHVLGVGHASLSLARATIRRPVDRLLDLGTGCGVQALHASRHANRITATDVSPRALALANATFQINELSVETLSGSWFEPVAGRRFDQVVCNPPFVVGPSRQDYVYRDSGLAGDAASALVVRELPTMLAEGGVGQLLASWLHLPGQDWEERVTGWLGAAAVDAWFVQRDVADPALYVGTWLRDAGVDPRSREGSAMAARWLDWFADNKVLGVGFGFVTIARTDGAPRVVCEDLRQAFADPLGREAAGWLDRVAWLRAHGTPQELLGSRFRVPDSVVLEEISGATDDGWRPVVRRLHRGDGPGWRHEIDELVAALLAGCRGLLPLRDLLELLAAAHGIATDAVVAAALPVVHELVLHGMLRPVAENP
jgi:methylase of polypeptide subunit release factors